MPSPGFSPLIEVFLLVDQPRQRLSHWSRALAPLDGDGAPPLATVDAYFDPVANRAIFGLRYDELSLGAERLRLLVEVTRLAEIGMIQPADLSEGERRRFVGEGLAKCTVHVGDQRTVVGALVELVRRVRAQRGTTTPPATTAMPPGQPRARTAVPGRPRTDVGDTEDPLLLVAARGTRESEPAGEPPLARSSRNLADGSVAPPFAGAAAADHDAVPGTELAGSSDRITVPAHQLAAALPQRRDDGPRPSPNVVSRGGVHRANTVTMSTVETQRMLDAASSPALDVVGEPQLARPVDPAADRVRPSPSPPPVSPIERVRPTTQPLSPIERVRPTTQPLSPIERVRPTTPPVPAIERRRPTTPPVSAIERRRPTTQPVPVIERVRTTTHPGQGSGRIQRAESQAQIDPDAPMIEARYLRDGRWVPIRIGALSLRGATLMAGALPRVDDRVDVALSYANRRATVRGNVTKVSTRQEAATSGAATFSVSFELEDASRRQLTELLTAARAANVTIRPPSPRSTRRYPVEWPVCLGTMRGAVRAEALDVSADGMFVKPVHALAIDASLTFSAVLDDGLSAVSGRSRVVRSITDSEAAAAGLLSGYGLSILEMPEPDRARWSAFLARIEKRAGKRVLIAASPTRLTELQSGLVAAGYAVTGGSEAGAIAQLAGTDARPVDAALVDAAWIADGHSVSWVESLFLARNVPCVTIHGDARRARIAIDRLLSVV